MFTRDQSAKETGTKMNYNETRDKAIIGNALQAEDLGNEKEVKERRMIGDLLRNDVEM